MVWHGWEDAVGGGAGRGGMRFGERPQQLVYVVQHSVGHHELDVGRVVDVAQWVAGDDGDVGEHALADRSDRLLEELSGRPGGGDYRLVGGELVLDHRAQVHVRADRRVVDWRVRS